MRNKFATTTRRFVAAAASSGFNVSKYSEPDDAEVTQGQTLGGPVARSLTTSPAG
jgi:hypothetical protein